MSDNESVDHDPSARYAGQAFWPLCGQKRHAPRLAWGGRTTLYDSAGAGSPAPSRQASSRRKMTACTVAVRAITP